MAEWVVLVFGLSLLPSAFALGLWIVIWFPWIATRF
jgi:hypothetical protein